MSSEAATAEMPTPKGTGPNIADLVIKDVEARAEIGLKKYGEKLKAHNGRNALWDAYQEAIDLCVYLRQKIQEEEININRPLRERLNK